MKFPREVLSQNSDFKRRYQRTSQMDPKRRYKKDQAIGGEGIICEDMICQAVSPFPRGKGGVLPFAKGPSLGQLGELKIHVLE